MNRLKKFATLLTFGSVMQFAGCDPANTVGQLQNAVCDFAGAVDGVPVPDFCE